MKEKDFLKIMKKDRYPVFLFESRINLPLVFAKHAWFVVNKKGKINRWEFGKFIKKAQKSWGDVHLNIYSPTMGLRIFRWKDSPSYESSLLGFIDGKSNSTAMKMASFIENKAKLYRYRNKYSLFGPNSNTFVQEILDKFPESKLKLSWNAFGKNWK